MLGAEATAVLPLAGDIVVTTIELVPLETSDKVGIIAIDVIICPTVIDVCIQPNRIAIDI